MRVRNRVLPLVCAALLLASCSLKPESSSEAPYVDDYDPYAESWEVASYMGWYPRPETEPVGQAADWEMWGKTVDTSHYNGIAVKNDGSVWTWGYNAHYQAGTGYNTFQTTPIKVLDDVLTVEMGANHATAIRTDGSLWMWGDNGFGQSGTGREDAAILYPEKVMENVATIGAHTNTITVIDKEQQLWTWGVNMLGGYYGTVGVGIYEEKETYDSVPQKKLDNVVTAVGADARVMALRADGGLWCWGYNRDGQSGMEYTERDGGYVSTYVLKPTEIMKDMIWTGLSHLESYAIDREKNLWVWGWIIRPEGDSTQSYDWGPFFAPQLAAKKVKAVYYNVGVGLIIKTDASLWVWGDNSIGQSGIGYAGADTKTPVKIMDNVRAASTGVNTSFAITEDDVLWGWGDNKYGQLGIGNNENQSAPVKVMEGVNSVYQTEGSYTVVLKQDGTLWTFGANYVGQLGDGTFEGRNKPVKILDDVRLPIPAPDWESRIWPEADGTEAASESTAASDAEASASES